MTPRHGMFFLISVILGFAVPLFYVGDRLEADWRYFDSLSLLIRSSIIEYGRFPLHDPWVCGGLDLLSNPQSRIFSPFVLLDIIFHPSVANWLGLAIYSLLGGLSMFRLLEFLKVKKITAYWGSFLWINLAWFAHRFGVGHIAYGSMTLFPLVLFCILHIRHRAHRFGLALLLPLFLLDGGIYTFGFSILLFVSVIAVRRETRQDLIFVFKKDLLYSIFLAVASLALAVPKVVPVVLGAGNRKPNLDAILIRIENLGEVLFYPFKSIYEQPDWVQVKFHEVGAYIGIVSVATIGLALWKHKNFFKTHRVWFILLGIWFWVAVGWLKGGNPWKLVHLTPYLNHIHVQSRTLILFLLVFIILLCLAVDRFKWNKKTKIALMVLIAAEFALVKNYVFYTGYRDFPSQASVSQLIDSRKVEKTIEEAKKPTHYYQGLGSAKCYEPAVRGIAPSVNYSGQSSYKGEVYVRGVGSAQVKEFVPGRLTLNYQLPKVAPIVVNTNFLRGWDIVGDHEGPLGEVKSYKGLLQFTPLQPKGQVTLEYYPGYLIWIFISYLLGVGLFFEMGLQLWKNGARDKT